jgi:hypothetical protein
MIPNRIKPRERDEIVAYLAARPKTPYVRVAREFSRSTTTVAGIARANGLARGGR